VTENFEHKGVVFRLTDSAGVRTSNEMIEAEGIQRTLALLEKSFFNILVVNPFETHPQSFHAISDKVFDLLIVTHTDVPGYEEAYAELKEIPKSKEIFHAPIGPLRNDFAIARIKQKIFSLVFDKYQSIIQKQPLLIERQKDLIRNIHQSLMNFEKLSKTTTDAAILSFELKLIGNSVEELVGIITPDEILSSIFSNFCIGK
jgi:tRNA modification GTPase